MSGLLVSLTCARFTCTPLPWFVPDPGGQRGCCIIATARGQASSWPLLRPLFDALGAKFHISAYQYDKTLEAARWITGSLRVLHRCTYMSGRRHGHARTHTMIPHASQKQLNALMSWTLYNMTAKKANGIQQRIRII